MRSAVAGGARGGEPAGYATEARSTPGSLTRCVPVHQEALRRHGNEGRSARGDSSGNEAECNGLYRTHTERADADIFTSLLQQRHLWKYWTKSHVNTDAIERMEQ